MNCAEAHGEQVQFKSWRNANSCFRYFTLQKREVSTKIILNGANGRMGRIVEEAIQAGGAHSVVARVDWSFAAGDGYSELNQYEGLADMVIDFSNHAATQAVAELAKATELCQTAYQSIRDQMEEITTSVFYTTYAEHSVAQGKTESFISAAAKKMIIGAIGGIVIACGLWFLSALAPEFRSKKEESEEKEAAER